MTLEMADLSPIKVYITKRKETISAYLTRFSNQLVWWGGKMSCALRTYLQEPWCNIDAVFAQKL